jgi:F0F1-type ATP synthase alpha subunit
LESDLFYSGQRPALNVGISVSRVGSTAQNKAMKKVSGKLKLDLVQYRELAAFTQFSTDVDAVTKKQIDRGSRMVELLKQGQYVPMAVENQVSIIWAGINGHLDDIPLSRVHEFESGFLAFLQSDFKKMLAKIVKEKVISPEIEKELTEAIGQFRKIFLKER